MADVRDFENYSDKELDDTYNDLVKWLLEIVEAHCTLAKIPPPLAGLALLGASVSMSRKGCTNEQIKECMDDSLNFILKGRTPPDPVVFDLRKKPEQPGTAFVIDGVKDLKLVLDSARSGNLLAVKVLDTIRDQAARGIPEALFIQGHLDQLVRETSGRPSAKTKGGG